MRLLLVEDDGELRGQLRRLLQRSGYQVEVAEDGIEALYYLNEYEIDLAVIDLGLPKLDGIDLIHQIRDAGFGFPVLILTARVGWKEKVKGLDAGADDYLTKPFQPEELSARINALMRRVSGFTQTRLVVGPISMDIKANTVYVQGQEVDLTTFEYKILEHFMMNPGRLTTRATLVDRLYADDEDKSSNVIEVIIARLRKKLDPESTYEIINTLRGRGYRFMSDKG
jgi:two-component system response regulator PhoP